MHTLYVVEGLTVRVYNERLIFLAIILEVDEYVCTKRFMISFFYMYVF